MWDCSSVPVLAPVTIAVFPFSCTGQARGSHDPLLCDRTISPKITVDTAHNGFEKISFQIEDIEKSTKP